MTMFNGWDIIYAPFLSPLYLWFFAGLIVALILLMLINRLPGTLLRGLGLSLLLFALLNPSLRQEQRDPLKNILLIVTDKSPSQVISGREGLVDQSLTKLNERLSDIKDLETEIIALGSDDPNAKDGTLAFSALREGISRLASNRIAGVVMITDGQVHDAPKKFQELGLAVSQEQSSLTGAAIPLHFILTGNKNQFDRRIEIVKAPKYGIVGSTRTLKLKIVEQGSSVGASHMVKLKFRQKGSSEKTQFVQVGEEITVPLAFPHAGLNLMEIELDTHEDEITPANNRAVISAEGVRENLRVLLVSGEPHAGERTWRNLLKSDASVDLVHFTILRPPEKQDGTPIHQLSLIAFPTRELFSEKLEDFDLIIFDRYQRRGVLPLHYLDNVSQYVLNGGAVLIAAGDHFATPLSLANTPLEQILPATPTGQVIEQAYVPKVTEKGQKHPVTHNLPLSNNAASKTAQWGRWFRLVEANVGEGETLMKGAKEHPLLVLNRLGEGRIALLLSDHAWLWARGFDGGGPYTTLLRRLSHWLMKEPDLEEEALTAVGDARNLLIKRRSMKKDIAPVRITQPDGTTKEIELKEVTPGTWQTKLSKQQLGIHRVQSGKLNALAYIGFASEKELKNIVTTDRIVTPLAKEAKSGVFWTGNNAKSKESESVSSTVSLLSVPKVSMMSSAGAYAGSGWMGLLDRRAYVVKGVKLIPLINGLLALAVLLLALGTMWWREGH